MEWRVVVLNHLGEEQYDVNVNAVSRADAVDQAKNIAARRRGKKVPTRWRYLTQGPFLWDSPDEGAEQS